MAILERETSEQIREGLTCASCVAVISGSSVQSLLYLQKLVAYWPKHGLRSDIRVPNFENFHRGACPQTPLGLSLFTPLWPYQSKIAGSGPDL